MSDENKEKVDKASEKNIKVDPGNETALTENDNQNISQPEKEEADDKTEKIGEKSKVNSFEWKLLIFYFLYCLLSAGFACLFIFVFHFLYGGKMWDLWSLNSQNNRIWGAIVIAYGVFIVIFSYFFVSSNLRKWLLVRHRLFSLAGNLRSGSGFFEIAFPGILCLVMACIILSYFDVGALYNVNPNPNKELDKERFEQASLVIHIFISLFSVLISTWLLHLTDYARVSKELSGKHLDHLTQITEWIQESTIARLERNWDFKTELYTAEGSTVTPDDVLPDREIHKDVLNEILGKLKKRLQDIPDEDFLILKEKYGNVVFLFYPDYLPHLAHVYLKISQLRALNMAPRRVQLLGRRWTARGLESEYVVVHDISELRTEYLDLSAIGRNLKRYKKITDEKDISPELQKQLEKMVLEPKWKQRSLKKRAIVQVAPDGSLLSINIEEERQFNI